MVTRVCADPVSRYVEPYRDRMICAVAASYRIRRTRRVHVRRVCVLRDDCSNGCRAQ
ncbi:hypothetical protein BSIN_2143 [Burkholderia singularis]|uniref:Uncharacterized protein n=1 Tax=Burkholderia singularis TaxID=1503053 RepID=A0A238H133_9BURK|nr:hypothetical protein BSIN_2143 [Burkholderia singularis]